MITSRTINTYLSKKEVFVRHVCFYLEITRNRRLKRNKLFVIRKIILKKKDQLKWKKYSQQYFITFLSLYLKQSLKLRHCIFTKLNPNTLFYRTTQIRYISLSGVFSAQALSFSLHTYVNQSGFILSCYLLLLRVKTASISHNFSLL